MIFNILIGTIISVFCTAIGLGLGALIGIATQKNKIK